MWHVGVGAYHEKLLVNGGSSSLEQVVSSLRNCKQCRWQIAEFQLDSSLRPMKFFSVAFIYVHLHSTSPVITLAAVFYFIQPIGLQEDAAKYFGH